MRQKEVLIILISAFILVIVWIGFNIYHNSVTSTISEKLEIRIAPINPDLNSKDIQTLKKRKKVSPIFDVQAPSTSSASQVTPPSGTPTPSPAPTITSAPTPTIPEGTPTL